jgi:hypothetical protein
MRSARAQPAMFLHFGVTMKGLPEVNSPASTPRPTVKASDRPVSAAGFESGIVRATSA